MNAHSTEIARQADVRAQAPEGPIISEDPATGDVVWQGEAGDVKAAAEKAHASWPKWAARPLTERLEVIRGLMNRIRRDQDALVKLMGRESGRPSWDCRAELDAVDELVDVALRFNSERAGQRRLEGRHEVEKLALRHKPHGAVAVLTPYSSPCLSAMRQIVPALLAGNSVLWKPSERGAGLADAIDKIIGETELSKGILQIVQGDGKTGHQLVTSPCVRAVCFTGSAHVGLALAKQLGARTDRPLSLNLGGNNPIIAWDFDDIHAGAVQIIRSAFQYSGQHCSAARRLIVSNGFAETLLEEVKHIAERLIVGAPFHNPTPFMGPVGGNDIADGLSESFLALMSHGGRPIKHLVRPQSDRPFLLPGIIDVTEIKDRPDIELFGPLLQVVRVDSFDDAIGEANRTRFHRAAALIGGTQAQFEKFWANSRAMRVNWNNVTFEGSPHAPVGGMGLAGNHRPGGSYTADFVAYPVHSAENSTPRGYIGIGIANDAKAARQPANTTEQSEETAPDESESATAV